MNRKDIRHIITTGNQRKGCREEIRTYLSDHPLSIVILDDDPTGTQTLYDVPVVTQWTTAVLEKEIENSPVFFILTNSRSLQAEDAEDLAILIGERLQGIANKLQKRLLVISRSDSTLRGHYPSEVDALAKGLGTPDATHILIPAFFEGGRYTLNDIHYVQEGDNFIPAAKTPFAKDGTFGYSSSDLKEYILEKYEGSVQANAILSLGINLLKTMDVSGIASLLRTTECKYIVVNAVSMSDLEVFALAAMSSNKTFVYRTAASFLNAVTGIALRPILEKNNILRHEEGSGTLVVVGSYVPKSTEQLAYLRAHKEARFIELEVDKLLEEKQASSQISRISETIESALRNDEQVVLYTSRKLYKGSSKKENLEIVNQVSLALIGSIKTLKVRPKYILAKGGITSSDIAVKALGTKRALVLGQALKGVPVWSLGLESKYPELPYIVFPGNVGDKTALYKLIRSLE